MHLTTTLRLVLVIVAATISGVMNSMAGSLKMRPAQSRGLRSGRQPFRRWKMCDAPRRYLLRQFCFAFSRLVNWPVALSMAGGAMAGGHAGSRVAQRVGHRGGRFAIIVIGLGGGLVMLVGELGR